MRIGGFNHGALSESICLQVKLEALAEQQFQLINVEAERDEVQAQVSTLQHALSGLQSVTGELDVRQVIRGYQTRELQSEQELQQLRSELQLVKREVASSRNDLATVQAKNHVRSYMHSRDGILLGPALLGACNTYNK